jgi:hypothetical protein
MIGNSIGKLAQEKAIFMTIDVFSRSLGSNDGYSTIVQSILHEGPF